MKIKNTVTIKIVKDSNPVNPSQIYACCPQIKISKGSLTWFWLFLLSTGAFKSGPGNPGFGRGKSTLKVLFVCHHHLANFYFVYELLFGLYAAISEITAPIQIISGTALHQTECLLLAPGGAASKNSNESPSTSSQLWSTHWQFREAGASRVHSHSLPKTLPWVPFLLLAFWGPSWYWQDSRSSRDVFLTSLRYNTDEMPWEHNSLVSLVPLCIISLKVVGPMNKVKWGLTVHDHPYPNWSYAQESPLAEPWLPCCASREGSEPWQQLCALSLQRPLTSWSLGQTPF